VVVDVEATPARTHDEVKATKTMKSTEDRQRGNLIERSEGVQRHDRKAKRQRIPGEG